MKQKSKLVDAIIEGMQDKKAHDIVCIDLRETMHATADFFVICHGESNTQVQAITDALIDKAREELGEKPRSFEGKTNAEWVLVDFFNVVAHVFYKDVRTFYDLESLWGDAKIEQIQEVG